MRSCVASGPLASSLAILAAARWAAAPGARWVASVSGTDSVLLRVLQVAAVQSDVVFVDTGYHFDETLDYLGVLERTSGRSIRRLRAAGIHGDRGPTPREPGTCCRTRKVEPIDAVLHDYDVWVTGIRRADSPARSAARAVLYDRQRQVLKVNPLVAWSDPDVRGFEADQELPQNPLVRRGYLSIGCAPCTSAPVDADARSGRWPTSTRTECGLHREFLAG